MAEQKKKTATKKKAAAKKATTKSKRRGRPSAYKPEYCEQLIDHMAEGYSFETFGVELRVDVQTLYNWAHQHIEFFEAKKVGEHAARMYFEKVGNQAMAGSIPNFATSVWVFSMKNRFNWKDRIEQEETKKVEIDEDKLSEKLNELLTRRSKRKGTI